MVASSSHRHFLLLNIPNWWCVTCRKASGTRIDFDCIQRPCCALFLREKERDKCVETPLTDIFANLNYSFLVLGLNSFKTGFQLHPEESNDWEQLEAPVLFLSLLLSSTKTHKTLPISKIIIMISIKKNVFGCLNNNNKNNWKQLEAPARFFSLDLQRGNTPKSSYKKCV